MSDSTAINLHSEPTKDLNQTIINTPHPLAEQLGDTQERTSLQSDQSGVQPRSNTSRSHSPKKGDENQLTVRSNLLLYEADGTNRLTLSTYLSERQWELESATSGTLEAFPDQKSQNPQTRAHTPNSNSPTSPKSPTSPQSHKHSPSYASQLHHHHLPVESRLGSVKGVYLPCFQNIIGIILFVRLSWIVGVAGIGQALLITVMSTLCTFLTILSLSAISTNGKVPSGGAYYLISRSMGPKWGGTVGLLFYAGNVVASVLYVLGAVEIVTNYVFPSLSLGSSETNARVYGTTILFMLALIVLSGIKFVNRASLVFLFAVIAAIFASLIGFLSSNRGGLPDGVVGFLGVFKDNWGSNYGGKDVNGEAQNTSFFVLFALFFPSVTGIMAGASRSGDLRSPGRSIPVGTLSAWGTTSVLYFTFIILMGTVISGDLLRTKRPSSNLLVALVAWPHPLVTTLGCLFASLGAGLQSYVSAPRLLQAIAKDDILPFLRPFKHLSKAIHISFFGRGKLEIISKGEPHMALLLSFIIAEMVCLIGSLDFVASVVTMLYLICYLFVNLSTALLGFLKEPSWRPTWRYYHWSISSFAAVLCLVYMFLISWYVALIALAVMTLVYIYIDYRGAAVQWGDGLSSFQLHLAEQNLMRLEKIEEEHVKNWRPQVLAFLEFDEAVGRIKYPNILSFLAQLRKGGGLNIVSTCLKGELQDTSNEKIDRVRRILKDTMLLHKLSAFTEVVVSPDVASGLSTTMQCSGIGVLRPNTVVLGFPAASTVTSASKAEIFVNAVRNIVAYDKALVLIKNPQLFPTKEIQNRTIDVYWIIHDGGILTLLPHLLKKHRVWRSCKLRIFAVAQMEDNSVLMKQALLSSLRHLRIDAHVEVLELGQYDVSEFAYEQTIRMQERQKMLKRLGSGVIGNVLVLPTAGSSEDVRIDNNGVLPKGPSRNASGVSHMARKSISGATEFMKKMRSKASIGNRREMSAWLANSDVENGGAGVLPSPTASPAYRRRGMFDGSSSSIGSESRRGVLRKGGGSASTFSLSNSTSSTSSSLTEEIPLNQFRNSSTESLSVLPEEVKFSFPSVPEPALVIPTQITKIVSETIFTLPSQSIAPQPQPQRSHPSVRQLRTETQFQSSISLLPKTLDKHKVDLMNTSVKLNALMKEHSSDAAIVFCNLPVPSPQQASLDWLEYLEVMTMGLERVVLVKGSGGEVVTAFF